MKLEIASLYELAITMVDGIGDVLAKHVISYCDTAENVFKQNKSKLLKIPNIGNKVADAILNADVLKKAEKEIELAIKSNTSILFYKNDHYPARLKQIYDSPVILYVKGESDMNAIKTVGIVGTRQSSNYGREMCEQIVKDLKRWDVQVISGLAYGIDIAAHKACIQHGVDNIAVMASGIDIIYPKVHEKYAMEICKKGALMTENAFGTAPDAPRFPSRNRIIAGLSDILIVVEAAEKGGALITAEIANNYNKEVMALPGRIEDISSRGCNQLIKQHKAHIYTSINDLIELMNWDEKSISKNTQTKKSKQVLTDLQLSESELKIATILIANEGILQIDELSWKSQLTMSQTASTLLNLEFAGHVKPLPGKKFKWIEK